MSKRGIDSIIIWVDRLTRRVQFIPSVVTDTAANAAKSFFRNVFKHHGIPHSIVSDRDSRFSSNFWKRLMDLCGIKLKMYTGRHLQTDSQSEVMKRMIENYLCCYCSHYQDNWDELLPAAEFAYSSAVSDDLGMKPFEMDLGWIPKMLSAHTKWPKQGKVCAPHGSTNLLTTK